MFLITKSSTIQIVQRNSIKLRVVTLIQPPPAVATQPTTGGNRYVWGKNPQMCWGLHFYRASSTTGTGGCNFWPMRDSCKSGFDQLVQYDGLPANEVYRRPDGRFWRQGQKALELMTELLECYSTPGNLVMDLTCGTGTTGEAAARNARHFFLCDKDAELVEMIKRDRLRKYLQDNIEGMITKDVEIEHKLVYSVVRL